MMQPEPKITVSASTARRSVMLAVVPVGTPVQASPFSLRSSVPNSPAA
jgi:hypothetical protein